MPVFFLRHIGANFALIEPISGMIDPGFGVGGEYPSHGLPGLPPHISGGPIYGGRPDNSLPGSPGHPDNRPPSSPPSVSSPGAVLVLVRDQMGIWHYHELAPGSPPPRPVPVPPPGHISGQPVPTPPGGVAGTPLPPTAAPKPV